MKFSLEWLTSFLRNRSAARIVTESAPSRDPMKQQFKMVVNHIRKSSTARWSPLDDFMWQANLRVIYNLQSIGLVAGYQPLPAHAGISYRLQSTPINGEFTLAATGTAVQAQPIQIPMNLSRELVKRLKSIQYELVDNALLAISSKVVQDLFKKAPTPAMNDGPISHSDVRRDIVHAATGVSEAVHRKANTIIVTSQEALDSVLSAAGTSFEPASTELTPIRRIGKVFGDMTLVYASGCGTPMMAKQALVTAIGDTEVDAGYVFAPFIPVAIDAETTTKETLSFVCLAGLDNSSETNPYYSKVQVV